jgi:hypothetical protein
VGDFSPPTIEEVEGWWEDRWRGRRLSCGWLTGGAGGAEAITRGGADGGRLEGGAWGKRSARGHTVPLTTRRVVY